MRKIFRNIHLWLSVPFGILITLICFSGAALVFEKEVMELCHRELYFVKKVEAAPLPMEQLMTKVAATLPDSVSVTGVNISSDPERAYQVTLSKPRRASMYVDQYTGEITGKYERAPFFNFMFRMHRWLLDSMKQDGGIFWGKMIVGTSTLMFVFVLISGVVVWWPRTRKALKNSLKIVANKGWRRFWYDLHVAGGMYALVFLLAMALTGLTWSFQWYRTGFYKTFGVEVQPSMGHGNAAANATAKGGKRTVNRRVGKAVAHTGILLILIGNRYMNSWPRQIQTTSRLVFPTVLPVLLSPVSVTNGEQTVISSIPVMARLPKLLSIRTWITPVKSVAGFTLCMWAVGAVC